MVCDFMQYEGSARKVQKVLEDIFPIEYIYFVQLLSFKRAGYYPGSVYDIHTLEGLRAVIFLDQD